MKPAINMIALKASLREALLGYRRERPHLSLRAIAKNSGCNRYFLTKLIDENDISTSIDLNQVLILSQFMTGRSCIKEAIEASGSAVKDALGKVFNLDFLGSKRVSLRMSQVDLYDTYNYFVLVLASYSRGTRRELVNKILGFRGEQALMRLLSNEIIVERSGCIHLKEGNEFTLSSEIMKQRIPDYLKYHSMDRCYQQKNFIQVFSEGLTEDAVKKIYDIHARMKDEIARILVDETNHGDVPFFTFACMDRFYDSDEEKTIEGSSSETVLELDLSLEDNFLYEEAIPV
jgi:hypothetical protein